MKIMKICTFWGKNHHPKWTPVYSCKSTFSFSGAPAARLSGNFAKFHGISWNSMKFRGISGKARRRSARKWKGWFGAIQVSISGGDFCLQNSKFTWFSWKKCNFHEFHEISQFSQKTALFAPKCTLGTLGSQKHQYSGGYGRISASGRKCALFAKSRTFCSFSHFLRKMRNEQKVRLFAKNAHFRPEAEILP